MSEELKPIKNPCPFCGGQPKQSLKKKYVCCSNINCPCSMTWFEVIEWNTRINKEPATKEGE